MWIFGSALTTESPRDLDVLLVYDEAVVPPHDAYALGDWLYDCIDQGSLRCSIILLSRREHAASRFAVEEAATQVWP